MAKKSKKDVSETLKPKYIEFEVLKDTGKYKVGDLMLFKIEDIGNHYGTIACLLNEGVIAWHNQEFIKKDIVQFITDLQEAKKKTTLPMLNVAQEAPKNMPEVKKLHIKSWGCFYPHHKLYVEQLYPELFVYNLNGKLGLAELRRFAYARSSRVDYYLLFENFRLEFASYPMKAVYLTPYKDKVEQLIAGTYKPRSFPELCKEIERALSLLYEFRFTDDLQKWKLFIGQTHLLPFLEASFFIGVDASKGGGKTTILENAAILSRHGTLLGDISASAIPRIIDELNLSGFIDEIDQALANKDDKDPIAAVLRKGQRRNNPYIRCEGKNNIPKSFDLHGAYGYSFRGEVEDALIQRSLRVHTAKSKDNMLPVLNLYKHKLLRPLADELFLWSVANVWENYAKAKEFTTACYQNLFTSSGVSIAEKRKELFDSFTIKLSPEEKKVLSEISGRNVEVGYICFFVCKILGIEIIELASILKEKEATEQVEEEYYSNALIEALSYIYEKNKHLYRLKDGNNLGCFYYPKSKVYEYLVCELKAKGIFTIGSKVYTKSLREVGFIDGYNMTSQRFINEQASCVGGKMEVQRSTPTHCLVYTAEILAKLGLPAEPKIEVIQ